jgi:uncharacterized membrane protein YciS (DUF1049 family)
MADYTSPYIDIPSYGKGPKSVYSTDNEGIFEVILNVSQLDDDDEWGKTETIALRQIIDRVTTLVQEVEDPSVTGTSGLINQVTALRKVVILDSTVFSSGVTTGCSLSIGSTNIASTVSTFGGTVAIAGTTIVSGTLRCFCGISVAGGTSALSGNFSITGNVTTYALSVAGPLAITDGSGGDASLAVAGPVTAETITAGTGIFNYLVTGNPGTSTFCGNVRIQKVTGPWSDVNGNLTVDDNLTVSNYLSVAGEAHISNTLSMLCGAQITANSIIPSTSDLYTIGNPVNKYKHMYLSGNLIIDNYLAVAGEAHISNTLSMLCGAQITANSIIPSTNDLYTIGNPVNKYKHMYLSGNLTIDNYLAVAGEAHISNTLSMLCGAQITANSIIPSADDTYYLGNPVNAFKGMYLSGNLKILSIKTGGTNAGVTYAGNYRYVVTDITTGILYSVV